MHVQVSQNISDRGNVIPVILQNVGWTKSMTNAPAYVWRDAVNMVIEERRNSRDDGALLID